MPTKSYWSNSSSSICRHSHTHASQQQLLASRPPPCSGDLRYAPIEFILFFLRVGKVGVGKRLAVGGQGAGVTGVTAESGGGVRLFLRFAGTPVTAVTHRTDRSAATDPRDLVSAHRGGPLRIGRADSLGVDRHKSVGGLIQFRPSAVARLARASQLDWR